MDSKKLKKVFGVIAKSYGFSCAFGGCYKQSLESIVVLEVQKDGILIATSEDDVTAVTGLVARTIQLFKNQKVVDIEIDDALNLFIEVEDGVTLLVFRDEYEHEDLEILGDNQDWDYAVPSEDLVLYVMKDSTIKAGKYNSPRSDALTPIKMD